MFRTLNTRKTVETIALLERRIAERFPDAGLRQVCLELHALAEACQTRSRWIAKPHWGLRLFVTLIIAGLISGLVYGVIKMDLSLGQLKLADLIQVLEAGINDVFLIGAAIFFLVSMESRRKRKRALAALHELRSIAHVIDMHQLTKDPSRILEQRHATASSPQISLTPFELSRYLDYCSEMLSLAGKLAAIYAQHSSDDVVLRAVNELEALTSNLSGKVWQKILILKENQQTQIMQSRPQ
ncbi:hypothetical protein KKB55_02470 [Myxococcota bacterium]|nr:hypothetical protein [Myxococcota bacterium]MBU1896618.1 hypothetical protein [Myxococcota bacterium]